MDDKYTKSDDQTKPIMAERKMLESLMCPVTYSALCYDHDRQELISYAARLAFPIRDGIPVMLLCEARPLE